MIKIWKIVLKKHLFFLRNFWLFIMGFLEGCIVKCKHTCICLDLKRGEYSYVRLLLFYWSGLLVIKLRCMWPPPRYFYQTFLVTLRPTVWPAHLASARLPVQAWLSQHPVWRGLHRCTQSLKQSLSRKAARWAHEGKICTTPHGPLCREAGTGGASRKSCKDSSTAEPRSWLLTAPSVLTLNHLKFNNYEEENKTGKINTDICSACRSGFIVFQIAQMKCLFPLLFN